MRELSSRYRILFMGCLIMMAALLSPVWVTGEQNSTNPVEENQYYNRIFLRLYLPKTHLYLGERVPLTISLFATEIQVKRASYPVLNQPELTVDDLGAPWQSATEMGGRTYQVLTFATAITPLKTGNFVLGPATLDCRITRNSLDTDEEEDPSSLRRVTRSTLTVVSDKIRFTVQALPTGMPSDFSGGIGRFTLGVTSPAAKPRVGEPFTVRMMVGGTGNLQNIKAPSLKQAAGFKLYPPRKTGKASPGQAVFEMSILPLQAGQHFIGPFTLSFFDPGSRRYRQISAVLPVRILPNPAFSAENTLKIQPKPLPESKMAGLKIRPGDLQRIRPPLVGRPVFWLWQLVPLIGVVIVIRAYRRRPEALSGQRMARRGKAARLATQQMGKIRILLERGAYEQVLIDTFAMVREYLGECFEIPAAGMTGTIVTKLVEDHPEIDIETTDMLNSFFTQYDRLCFAGAGLSADIVTGFLTLAEMLIEKIGKTALPESAPGSNVPFGGKGGVLNG